MITVDDMQTKGLRDNGRRWLMMHYHERKQNKTKKKYREAQSRDVTRWRPPNSSDRTRACFKIVCCSDGWNKKETVENGSRGFWVSFSTLRLPTRGRPSTTIWLGERTHRKTLLSERHHRKTSNQSISPSSDRMGRGKKKNQIITLENRWWLEGLPDRVDGQKSQVVDGFCLLMASRKTTTLIWRDRRYQFTKKDFAHNRWVEQNWATGTPLFFLCVVIFLRRPQSHVGEEKNNSTARETNRNQRAPKK